MSWFWRAVIALTAASGFAIWYHRELHFQWLALSSFSGFLLRAGGQYYDPTQGSSSGYLFFALTAYVPVVLVALIIYGLLGRFVSPRASFVETRCRKCRYILRGISEPRCPECGERI